MMKIKALNESGSSDDDYYTNIITKEAQEQIILNEYSKALKLILKNDKKEALKILEDLLTAEILDEVHKSLSHDGRSRPLLSLKYCCYKNLAYIYDDLNDHDNAIGNYWKAVNLDDSDVTLWYKFGNLALKISNLELSSFAFHEGLKRNKNHWPCLDKIITLLFSVPDYMNCLSYISVALEKDPTYIKGLTLREFIFRRISLFKVCHEIYNIKCMSDLSLDSIRCNKRVRESFIEESNDITQKWFSNSKTNVNKILKIIFLRRQLSNCSWLELGKSLLDMYNYIIENNLSFVNLLELSVTEKDNSNIKKIFCNNEIYLSEEKYKTDISILASNRTDSTDVQNSEFIPFQLNTICNSDPSFMEIDIEDKVQATKEELYVALTDSTYLYETGIREVNDTHENPKHTAENQELIFSDMHPGNKKNSLIEKSEGEVLKTKKRRRSSLCFLTQWAWSTNIKRPSRARISHKKEYEKDGFILEETLKQILPYELLSNDNKLEKDDSGLSNEDSTDTLETYSDSITNELILKKEDEENLKLIKFTKEAELKYFETSVENNDVLMFIENHTSKSNVIQIILGLLKFLAYKWNSEWPKELPDVYINLYRKIRQHLISPTIFNGRTQNFTYTSEIDIHIILLFCEFCTDKWLSNHKKVSSNVSLNTLGIGVPSDELGFIVFYDVEESMQCKDQINFSIRLLWLKAIIFLYQGDPKTSLCTFKQLLHYMQELKTDTFKPFLQLVNCKYNATISSKSVEKMITLIQRKENFNKIQFLYQNNRYDELIDILKDTFFFSKHLNQFILSKDISLDRIEYLHILQESLWKIHQYEDCFVWSEACFDEAWRVYLQFTNISATEDEKNRWMALILYSLEKLNDCVTEVNVSVVRYLSNIRRTRFVQNLVHILCHQLDNLEKTSNMSIETVLPWILLHYILQFEEDKRKAKSSIALKNELQYSTFLESRNFQDNNDYDDDESIPASIMILLKAHKFLGRHGLCCIKDGQLLTFIIEFLVPKLNFPSFYYIKHKLKEPLEQAIYCLYGYPWKLVGSLRSKPKYLEDHVKNYKLLTWEASEILFEFYKPDKFPSFESKRVDSINTDTVTLFKKICTLIPPDSDPNFVVNEMNAYLLGQRRNIPCVKRPLNNYISHIYYLIADHYFKAASIQSWPYAIKYYTLDICLHPDELNSWAGLAMSTSTEMETWLNNFEPDINEEKYLNKAKIAQISYQHAISLAPSHLIIWTEFGNFLYTVHSFCSRLLKQESDSLNMNKFRILEAHKDEMLAEAKKCFLQANHIYTICQGTDEQQDERWLYQYMLAKISEKKNENPPIFLEHYLKASYLLNENSAEYPEKISHKSPQNLAVEALEVYYRIHASILKYFEQHEDEGLKYSLSCKLETTLKKCMKFPFIRYKSIFHDTVLDQECLKNSQMPWCNLTLNRDSSILNKPQSQKKTNSNKFDCRKRCHDESIIISDSKKIKLNDVSHLQVMHDVVALTDDLITKVCEKVSFERTNFINENKISKLNLKNTVVKKPLEQVSHQTEQNSLINETMMSNLPHKEQTFGTTYDRKFFEKRPKNEKTKLIPERHDNLDNQKLNKTSPHRRNSLTSTTSTSSSDSNNSSTSSSEDTSSSDESSESSSSSDSDTNSIESNIEKKKKNSDKVTDRCLSVDETRKLVNFCIAGLEQCALRFPEHYKSIYRLAHFFFCNKIFKDINKSKQLLLDKYVCQFYPNKTIQGLFAERKNSNFFNGIWRIPINEIDRPGSFASHMSKCILLLMQVLKETGDSRMLTELCIQLRKTPEADKKYLRDNEREQLSSQALTLCLQCLRNKIKESDTCKITAETYHIKTNERMKILLDVYHTYLNTKNIQEYEVSEMPKIRKLLEDAYILLFDNATIQGNVFDLAKDFCRSKIRANKVATGSSSIFDQMTCTAIPVSQLNLTPSSESFTFQSKKSVKTGRSGNLRGKSQNKLYQSYKNDSRTIQHQLNMMHTSSNVMYASNTSNSRKDSHPLDSFINANLLASVINSNFGVNIPSIHYFNQAENYRNFTQQYNNVNTLNSNESISNLSFANNAHIDRMESTRTNLDTINKRPDISITPVTNATIDRKLKFDGLINCNKKSNYKTNANLQTSKTAQSIPAQHYLSQKFLPYPTAQQMLPTSELIANSSTKSEEQICNTQTSEIASLLPKVKHCSDIEKEHTSLQHKLKKQINRSHHFSEIIDVSKNHKKSEITNAYHGFNYENLLAKISNVSVNLVNSASNSKLSKLPNLQKPVKPRISKISSTENSSRNNDTNMYSMISQLQQHSHLEIIPQSEYEAYRTEKESKKYLNATTTSKAINISNDNILVSEIPKRKVFNNSTGKSETKNNGSEKCAVEVITLDD